MYKFSIITPTLNRSKYLPRVYNSLCKQGITDFEWIIVDDGSTDNTKDTALSFEKLFEIKYLYKENAGKPSAMNYGIQNADSYISLSLDDDDILCPNTLKDAWEYFDMDTKTFKNNCVCLSGLSIYENGDIIGHKFPHDYYVSDHIRYVKNQNILGDKCDFFLTEIYRKFPFPLINNDRQIAPGIINIQVSFIYKILYINHVFQQKEFLEGGLSTQNYWYKNPFNSEYFYNVSSVPPFNLKLQIKNSAKYIFYARMNKKKNIFKNANNKNIFFLGLISYNIYTIKEYLCKFPFFKKILKPKSYNKNIT